MKNRKPFNLDRLIQVYNIIQVVACAYLFIEVSTGSSKRRMPLELTLNMQLIEW